MTKKTALRDTIDEILDNLSATIATTHLEYQNLGYEKRRRIDDGNVERAKIALNQYIQKEKITELYAYRQTMMSEPERLNLTKYIEKLKGE